MLTMTHLEPVGVVGAILPWNSPVLLLALKAAPALVAGNAVVVKAAEEATLAALRTAQIMSSVLPEGLLSVVSGAGEVCGAALVSHPKIGKITFTGSVETGRIISRAAADKLIPVTLELGGKSPMIVMPDADLDRVVAGAVTAMRFTRQGQSCTAATRIFVHEDLHDRFVAGLTAMVDAMEIGDPLDERTDIGTIISRAQFDRVRTYVSDAESTPGVVAHACGTLPTSPELAEGFYVRPVIVTGIGAGEPAAREEIFGPVTCVFAFTDYEDVIEAANDSTFGLTASIWTNDLRIALDATRRLEAGVVQVNQSVSVSPGLTYGGIKNSGLGKEGSLEAMKEHFMHKKLVIFNMA